MARTQAADYASRRTHIREVAATLYAAHGFLGASIAEVAAACATSKSLIYHYYASKEDILFDVMDSHVLHLMEGAALVEVSKAAPDIRIRDLARELMRRYEGAAAYQKVLLNELGNLPPKYRAVIVEHQRALLALVDRLLLELRPDLADDKPYRTAAIMMFFGMLNWTHTWRDPSGPVSGEAIADIAAGMFVSGLRKQASSQRMLGSQ